MPIYEFSCDNCRKLFTFFSRRIDTLTTPPCPRCARQLSRQVSLFSARSSNGESGEWDVADDEENPDIPDFDTSDPRMRQAISELGDKIERLDDTDTEGAARLMREFSERSGVSFNSDINEALCEMEAGADADEVTAKFGDALNATDAVFSSQSSGLRPAQAATAGHPKDALSKARPWTKDTTLYDMP